MPSISAFVFRQRRLTGVYDAWDMVDSAVLQARLIAQVGYGKFFAVIAFYVLAIPATNSGYFLCVKDNVISIWERMLHVLKKKICIN